MKNWKVPKHKSRKVKDKPGNKDHEQPFNKRFTRSSLIEVSTACGVKVDSDDIIHEPKAGGQSLDISYDLSSFANLTHFDDRFIDDYSQVHHSESKYTDSEQDLEFYVPPHIKNTRNSWGEDLDRISDDLTEGVGKRAFNVSHSKKSSLFPRLTRSAVKGYRKSRR